MKDSINITNTTITQAVQESQITTNPSITLGQLKTMIHSTAGRHLPTAKQLREHDQLFLFQPLYDGELHVFTSGFAVCRAGKHTAVLRVDRVSTYFYEFATTDKPISLDDQPWATALTLVAEKRMEDFQADRLSRRCVGFADDYDDEDSEDRKPSDAKVLAGTDDVEETVACRMDDRMKKLLDCLTARQRQVVTMYYIDQRTQQQIANELGISQQVVDRLIKAGIQNMKKSQNYFSEWV
ncbi:MAG: sigma-70 family RNA polymerase sigma factor [Eubacteriales bacterium]|nr:sigma-70 family RNA polymerase sigma factor [Eubacteriales bacterium]